MLRQVTIRRPVHAIGIGVHSGKKVRMTLRPAGENTGIVFVRTDAAGARVRADALNVADTTLSTTVAQNGVNVATVEHLMSALWGMEIDNLLVELNSEEVPIMDGSAAPFIYLLKSVGVIEQRAPKEFIRITGLTHVRTSAYYPQSNGKLERWHGSLKQECVRPGAPATIDEARRRMTAYVNHYNHVRLHSAIGYITPGDKLCGLEKVIAEDRDEKLAQARERRRRARQQQRAEVA